MAGGAPLKRARSALLPRGRRCRCPQAWAEATPGCRSIESPPSRRHRHRPVRPRSPSHRDIRPMTGRPNCFLLSCHPAVRTPDAVSSPTSCASAPTQSHMPCPSSTKAPATLLDIARGLRSRPLRALALHVSTASGTRGYRAGSCGEGGVSDLNAWGAFAFGTRCRSPRFATDRTK